MGYVDSHSRHSQYRQDLETGFKVRGAQLSHIHSRWVNEQLDHLFQYRGQINTIPHTHTPALPHCTRSEIKRLPERLRVTWTTLLYEVHHRKLYTSIQENQAFLGEIISQQTMTSLANQVFWKQKVALDWWSDGIQRPSGSQRQFDDMIKRSLSKPLSQSHAPSGSTV